MKKVFLVLILILSILFFSVSKNINLYVTENKLYKAESITLRSETGFAINNGLLTGIEHERTVNDFDLGLDTKYTTIITDKNGNTKTSGYIFTGDIIQIKNNNEIVSSPKVVIKGDVNSDGKISPLDYVVIKNHIMQSTLITGSEYLKAADFDNDGNVKPLDYVKIKNYIMDRSEEKYTIKYNANGGTGSVSSQQVVKDETTNVRRNTFTKEGSNFVSWNTKADGSGTEYKEASKIKVTKNVTLYAQWGTSAHTLSIQYNGNGGKWITPKYDTYSVNSDGTVILKSTGEIYNQTVKYGEYLSDAGLVNYNGSYMNWIKDGNSVPLGKEYYIDGTNITLDHSIKYYANELADLIKCDLSKKDCSMLLKVNYVLPITISGKKYKTRYNSSTGYTGYPQNFAIANFGKSNEILYISTSETGHIPPSTTDSAKIESIKTTVVNKYTVSNKNTSLSEKMFLKSSGHGQPFDYDSVNDVIITNDYATTVTYGTMMFGSSTGIMGIKFSKVNKGGNYSKLFSYNLDMKEPFPIIDNEAGVFGRVKGTNVYLYDYDYNSLKNGTFDFNNAKHKFTITRAEPTKYNGTDTISSQGFALYNGFLYEVSGGYGKDAYLEAFNMSGQSVYKIKLANGYTTSGSREVEGVKVYNNNVYIFSAYSSGTKADVGYYE